VSAADNSQANDLNPRQRRIVEMIGGRGFIPIDELARHFSVSPQTIRSDVNRLCQGGTLRRYHGGIGPVSTLENATFDKRRVLRHRQKIRIATLIAAHIPDRASLFIHYGTTMEAVAAALGKHTGLLIVTNNLSAVPGMTPANSSQIILAGGKVSLPEQCTQGEAAVNFIGQFNVDFGVLSVGSVGPDGTLYEFGYEVAQTARPIIQNAKQVFLAVDRNKFGRKGLIRIGHLRDVSAVFTDAAPPAGLGKILKSHRVPVHVA